MDFEVTILGSNSAIPAYGRHPSAQIIKVNEKLYLIDCGEGTQSQFVRFKIKKSRINHIFISHLHGDHFFGLFGLITSYNLLDRQKPLHIYGPAKLFDLMSYQLQVCNTKLKYDLVKHILRSRSPKLIFENSEITVETIILNHRIPCNGFLFKEKKQGRKILKHKTDAYKVPVEFMESLVAGKDFVSEKGVVVKNEKLTKDPPPPRSYAYCSDTAYDESIVKQIKNVNLLYHETTFAKDLKQKAKDTFHSTTTQAASIAKKAKVGKLLIGHI